MLIASGKQDDIEVMALKNHAGADLFAVHPLALNIVAVKWLFGETPELHQHGVGSQARPGIAEVHWLTDD